MKKRLKFLFFGFALLVLGYYVHTRYHQLSSMKGVVHQNAHFVAKIGIHDVKESLVLDALGSLAYYRDQISLSSSKDNESGDGVKKGVELMPHNLLVFGLPYCPHTLFAVFDIDDSLSLIHI